MKALCFGSMNIDNVYHVQHIVMPGETISSTLKETFVGGKGMNQAVAMARAGLDVYMAGKRGRDGECFANIMQEEGITSLVKVEEAPSGHAIIQVSEEGQNCIVLFGGTNTMMTPEYIDDVLAQFSEGDYIVLQNEINLLDVIIDKAYEKKMQVILNPSPFNDAIKRCDLKKVSLFMINEIEGEQISGISSTEPEKILDWFKTAYPDAEVVLTLGSNGAMCQKDDDRVFQPVIKTNVVDTTAAGDTFSGYVLAGKANGMSRAEYMLLAARASSVTVSRKGASPSIPRIAELLEK